MRDPMLVNQASSKSSDSSAILQGIQKAFEMSLQDLCNQYGVRKQAN